MGSNEEWPQFILNNSPQFSLEEKIPYLWHSFSSLFLHAMNPISQ